MAAYQPHPSKHEELQAEEREVFSPGVGRLVGIVFGVALLLGLVTGGLWIIWNLLRLHVFR
jgi:hypothetical protein